MPRFRLWQWGLPIALFFSNFGLWLANLYWDNTTARGFWMGILAGVFSGVTATAILSVISRSQRPDR